MPELHTPPHDKGTIMSAMQMHPAAEIFPRMTPEDFERFKADISANGLREPVWLYEGLVLDGRHRMMACEELGIEPSFREYTGDDPAGFVVSLNLHRRHLDTSQRAMVAARLANLSHGQRADYLQAERQFCLSVTQSDAAELLNVGERSVRSARTVLNEGVPELIEAVEQGEVAVSAAAEIANLPVPEQGRALAFVQHNSGDNEWYTPPEIIAAAREAMGGIDLDPASCDAANRTVQSGVFYTKADDGLTQAWRGRVWLNPPYAKGLIGPFAEAVTAKYLNKEIDQACVLVNNATETAWFQGMARSASLVCLVQGRLKYMKDEGATGAPLQGQAVLYFGARQEEFIRAFRNIGVIYARI